MVFSKMVFVPLMFAAFAVAGCSKEGSNSASKDAASNANSGQHHTAGKSEKGSQHTAHGLGPNGGIVFDLGKYHAEFTVDHANKTCAILVLGDDETTATPIAAEELTLTTKQTKTSDGTEVPPMTIKLLPKDWQDNKATTFVGTDPGMGHVAEFEGTVLGMIDGKPSQGEFSEVDGAVGHSHSHGDDALVWEGEPRQHAGLEIKLGHHGTHLHAGEPVEPAVSVTRNGEAVSDCKVYNSLVGADGNTVIAAEVATIFEPSTTEEPAHYAQGALMIPQDAEEVIIRFRVVSANSEEATFDVPIQVE